MKHLTMKKGGEWTFDGVLDEKQTLTRVKVYYMNKGVYVSFTPVTMDGIFESIPIFDMIQIRVQEMPRKAPKVIQAVAERIDEFVPMFVREYEGLDRTFGSLRLESQKAFKASIAPYLSMASCEVPLH